MPFLSLSSEDLLEAFFLPFRFPAWSSFFIIFFLSFRLFYKKACFFIVFVFQLPRATVYRAGRPGGVSGYPRGWCRSVS